MARQTELAELSDEEIEERNRVLMARKEEIREEQLALARELDRRAAVARVEAMTDAERAAIVHTIGVAGISSEERVGA